MSGRNAPFWRRYQTPHPPPACLIWPGGFWPILNRDYLPKRGAFATGELPKIPQDVGEIADNRPWREEALLRTLTAE